MVRIPILHLHEAAEVARRLNIKVATAYVARSKVQRMIREEMGALEKAQQTAEKQEA